MQIALVNHLQRTIARTEIRLKELRDMLNAAQSIQAAQNAPKEPPKPLTK